MCAHMYTSPDTCMQTHEHTCTQACTDACMHMRTVLTSVSTHLCCDASGLKPCSPECLLPPAHASPGSAGPLGLGPHPAPSTSSQHPWATCPRSASPCPAIAAIFQTTLPPSDSEPPGGKMVFDQAPLSSVQHKLPYKNRYK